MPKKKYQVIKATTNEISGLTVGGRVKKFKKNGTFETDDAGEAAEINKVLGAKGTGEVVVTNYDDKEPGHRYKFGGFTSTRARENYDHIFRKSKKKRTDAEVSTETSEE